MGVSVLHIRWAGTESNVRQWSGNESLQENILEVLIATTASGAIYGAIIVGSLKSTDHSGKSLGFCNSKTLLSKGRPSSDLCRHSSYWADSRPALSRYHCSYFTAEKHHLPPRKSGRTLYRRYTQGIVSNVAKSILLTPTDCWKLPQQLRLHWSATTKRAEIDPPFVCASCWWLSE